ncbi:MAG TPA: MFS transporter [Ktedonobacteraceae bacterium]|nr:MFS transporter [Ktedonobacteraceae bacterium]
MPLVAGVLPEIAHTMMISDGLAGQLVTAFTLTLWTGSARVLVLALFGFCLANIGSVLAPTYPLLLLTRILAGACAAAHAPLACATSTQLAPPEKRGRALALVAGLGFVVGSWISGVADRFGTTRALVVSLLVLTIILAIFSWATTSLLTGLPALFLWAGAGSSIFTPSSTACSAWLRLM